MKPTQYRQCSLSRTICETVERTTTWLPSKYAVAGVVLRLLNGGDWEDGWIVDSVAPALRDEADLPDPPRDFRRHKRGTGDSLRAFTVED